MNDLGIIFCVGLIFLFFFMIRNSLIFKIRTEAMRLTGIKSMRLVDEGKGINSLSPWEDFTSQGSYDYMMFDLRKWTFKQFYPGLEKD